MYSTIFTIIGGTIILLLLASFILSLLFAHQKRYYKHLQEISRMKETYQQEILKTQLEIKEQTLQNISQEIHDNIGQVLSLANLQLTAIELQDNPYATKKIEKSMELVSKAITDLRDLSKTLNAENIAKAGLKAAIQLDLEILEKSGFFMTRLHVEGAEKRLEFSKEIIVYRMIQEAMTNIIKHAKATSILITVSYTESVLIINIIDNGKGFESAGNYAHRDHGAGLQNMHNRANLIKGNIDIESTPSGGTKVQITVPFLS